MQVYVNVSLSSFHCHWDMAVEIFNFYRQNTQLIKCIYFLVKYVIIDIWTIMWQICKRKKMNIKMLLVTDLCFLLLFFYKRRDMCDFYIWSKQYWLNWALLSFPLRFSVISPKGPQNQSPKSLVLLACFSRSFVVFRSHFLTFACLV